MQVKWVFILFCHLFSSPRRFIIPRHDSKKQMEFNKEFAKSVRKALGSDENLSNLIQYYLKFMIQFALKMFFFLISLYSTLESVPMMALIGYVLRFFLRIDYPENHIFVPKSMLVITYKFSFFTVRCFYVLMKLSHHFVLFSTFLYFIFSFLSISDFWIKSSSVCWAEKKANTKQTPLYDFCNNISAKYFVLAVLLFLFNLYHKKKSWLYSKLLCWVTGKFVKRYD